MKRLKVLVKRNWRRNFFFYFAQTVLFQENIYSINFQTMQKYLNIVNIILVQGFCLLKTKIALFPIGFCLKVAGNSFQYFSRLSVGWVIITTLYLLTPTSWYHQTAQSLGNKLPLILWHNRLPQQQYELLKTPLILALSAYNSKTNSVAPNFLSSKCNQHDKMQLFAKFKKILRRGFRATLNV